MKRRRRKPVESRFWAKVHVTPHCWEWMAARSGGYGVFSIERRQVRAHVYSWSMANGRAPNSGEVVRHKCDNPPCVNPSHLLIGTRRDNERDKVERGRHHSQLKDACTNGHPYETHGSVDYRGSRYCLTCRRHNDKVRMRRNRINNTKENDK